LCFFTKCAFKKELKAQKVFFFYTQLFLIGLEMTGKNRITLKWPGFIFTSLLLEHISEKKYALLNS
jgi:hypothetical protein